MTIADILRRAPTDEPIEYLRLRSTSLEGLSDAFLVLPELGHLAIIHTDLPELPETITHCSQLGQLLISYSGLARLPENIGLCRWLHSVIIVHNKLRRLPASLSECLNLRIFRVEFNQLSEFPDWVVQLPWIREIGFNNNRLSSVPDTPWACRMLSSLDLSNNRIAALTQNISLLNLEYLYLRSNRLTELPEEWLKSKRLKNLDIAHNRIRSLPALPTSLQHLDISGCPIAGRPDQLFDLTELRSFRGLSPDGRKLPAFMAACRKSPVPKTWRPLLFDAFCGRAETLTNLSREQCLRALQLSLPNLRTTLLRHLKTGNPLADSPTPGARMALIGKFSEPLKGIKTRLEAAGMQVADISLSDWIVLGRPPYRLPEQLPPVFSILTEDDLASFQDAISAPPIDALQTARLRELLLHPDETNVELALLLLKNVQTPTGLHTELLCARIRSRSARLKRGLSEKLRAITPVEELHILTLPFSVWMKKSPQQAAVQIARQLSGTSFDGAQLFQWLSAPR